VTIVFATLSVLSVRHQRTRTVHRTLDVGITVTCSSYNSGRRLVNLTLVVDDCDDCLGDASKLRAFTVSTCQLQLETLVALLVLLTYTSTHYTYNIFELFDVEY